VMGIGAGTVWYFFLRPSEVIPIQPAPSTGAPRKPRPSKPTQPAPAETPATSPAPAPGSATQSPAPSPAPVQVSETPATTAAKPAPAQPVPAPQPSPAPAKPAPASAPAPVPPSAKPQPAPAPSPASGQGHQLLAAGKYPEAASAFLGEWAKSNTGFTVEIEVACQADSVAKGVAAAAGSSEYAILPFDLKGRSCYLVVWGSYPDRAGADAALKALPAFFQTAAQPKVVPKAKVLELSHAAP